jgi:hypothetical protein
MCGGYKYGGVVFIVMVFTRCGIDTLPMHKPIYPEAEQEVILTLEARADWGITNIELTVSNVSPNGGTNTQQEIQHTHWHFDNAPTAKTIEHHIDAGIFEPGVLIKYQFTVSSRFGMKRSHDVTFEVQPHDPDDSIPIPIYTQGHQDHVTDIVFIPDEDIDDINAFYQNCGSLIEYSFFNETTIRKWCRQFNFYINQFRGKATTLSDAINGNEHGIPLNWEYLTFSEMQVILHETRFTDYTGRQHENLCSSEQTQYGALRHEAGHAAFGLADEYCAGWHAQVEVLPNNWGNPAITELAVAQNQAKRQAMLASFLRHKTPCDAKIICEGSRYYKLCDAFCQMKNTGEQPTDYDKPCADRVEYSIKKNASNTENGE